MLHGTRKGKPRVLAVSLLRRHLPLLLRPVGAGVDIEGEEFDCPVGSELTNDGKRPDQLAGGDEQPIIVSTWDELGKTPKSDCEPFDDFEQLERLEVVR
jgi:hypothetical protein